MEQSVRYLPTEAAVVDGELLMSGNKPALCCESNGVCLAVVNNEQAVEVMSVRPEVLKKSPMVPGPQGEETYPPQRFIDWMQKLDPPKRITAQAIKLMGLSGKNPKRQITVDFSTMTDLSTPKPEKQVFKKSPLIKTLSKELSLSPTQIRKHLRAGGLTAPYTDEKLIRKTLKNIV